ncbi:unnamed protein product [Orchesella dallaii]|uniref:Uncharacterized protein n=1 Tax=Orchesella dallaii TaxID=48710 RepID=A0ABP1Q0A1_9HEXA
MDRYDPGDTHLVFEGIRNNRKMVAGVVDGHPVLSIPAPHPDDHPGLAQFTGASIVPMLRFYSFSFRTFIIMSLAFVLILRPYIKFIKIHGKDAPAAFQKKLGKVKWDFRSLQDSGDDWIDMRKLIIVLDAIETMF